MDSAALSAQYSIYTLMKILVATELKFTKSYALLQLSPFSCTQGDFIIHLLFKLVKSFS